MTTIMWYSIIFQRIIYSNSNLINIYEDIRTYILLFYTLFGILSKSEGRRPLIINLNYFVLISICKTADFLALGAPKWTNEVVTNNHAPLFLRATCDLGLVIVKSSGNIRIGRNLLINGWIMITELFFVGRKPVNGWLRIGLLHLLNFAYNGKIKLLTTAFSNWTKNRENKT